AANLCGGVGGEQRRCGVSLLAPQLVVGRGKRVGVVVGAVPEVRLVVEQVDPPAAGGAEAVDQVSRPGLGIGRSEGHADRCAVAGDPCAAGVAVAAVGVVGVEGILVRGQ